jgi:hypothetical protein
VHIFLTTISAFRLGVIKIVSLSNVSEKLVKYVAISVLLLAHNPVLIEMKVFGAIISAKHTICEIEFFFLNVKYSVVIHAD